MDHRGQRFPQEPRLDHGLGHAAPPRRRTRLGRAQCHAASDLRHFCRGRRREARPQRRDTEAAKDKLAKIKQAFEAWIWTDTERADRLAKIYNERFNNLVPRRFDGSHLTIPGASSVIKFYEHQKRAIWRILSAGSTYVAHAVGAGKTFTLAAAVMEQKRLGLITKPMMTVPGHCLAQAAREFLQLYPTANILVADETNFVKDKRQRFLARAATANWDCIIITHSAFKFIPRPPISNGRSSRM